MNESQFVHTRARGRTPARTGLDSARRYVLVIVAAVALAGCDAIAEGAGFRKEFRGTLLPAPLEKPDFVFPTAAGDSFDFRRETDGDIALLFFGYTYCPDICPVHMSNISAVLSKMSGADTRRVHVIFVTTDPDRDTPERLKSWLEMIDPRIVGLRPTEQEAIRLQSSLNIQPAIKYAAKPGHEGNYQVGHAAQVIAFTPDNKAHVVYPDGIRQADWAHDLPLLLERSWK